MLLRTLQLPRPRIESISRDAPKVLLLVLILSPAAWPAERSVPLQELLQSIARSGVQLVYSSETISPDLRAVPPPPELSVDARLKSILTPFQLEAQRLPNGGYVIVRSPDPGASLEVIVTIEHDGVASPLPGAEVSLQNTQHYARTDRSGRVMFGDLAPADYLVDVRFDGLRAARRSVRVSRNAPAHTDVRVMWEPVSLEEITITSNRYDSGATLGVPLLRETIESLPIVGNDAARSLQLLPGAAVAGYSAKTHVRGGRDDETLFRFDGLTLTDPYHLEAFQSLLSAIDPAIIESTTSWTGLAPIQFGDRIGAVVDIEPRAIARRTVDVKLSNRDAGLLLGTPFDDARGTVSAAVRLSNAYSPAQWAEPESFSPDYRDYILRATWEVGPRTRFSVGAFALYDRRHNLDTLPTDQRARVNEHERYGWLRLLQEFSPAVHSETLLSHESSENILSGRVNLAGIESGFLAKHDRILALTVREELTVSPAPKWSLLIGGERTNAAVDDTLSSHVDFRSPFVPELQPNAEVQQDSDISLRAVASSVYGGVQWNLSNRTLADVGVRRDSRQYDSGVAGDSHWSIRANLRQRLSEITLVRLGWGQTTQASAYDVSRAADGSVQPAPTRLLSQINLSVEQVLSGHWFLRAAIYDKHERSSFQAQEDVFSPFTLLPEIALGNQLISTQGAHLRGFETRLESDRSRPLSGWLSYTWSRAEDKIAARWVPRSWDQPNAVQMGTRWREGPWQVTGLLSWHTGWPYTPLVISNTGGPNPTLVSVALAPRNSARLANFVSLDLRVTWEHALAGGVFQTFLELNDVTNSKTVCCQNYNIARRPDGTSQLIDSPGVWVAFAPALGFRWQR